MKIETGNLIKTTLFHPWDSVQKLQNLKKGVASMYTLMIQKVYFCCLLRCLPVLKCLKYFLCSSCFVNILIGYKNLWNETLKHDIISVELIPKSALSALLHFKVHSA